MYRIVPHRREEIAPKKIPNLYPKKQPRKLHFPFYIADRQTDGVTSLLKSKLNI